MTSYDFFTDIPGQSTQGISTHGRVNTTDHRLFFASEYFYKPRGLDYIRREFNHQLSQIDVEQSAVKLNYDDEQFTFLINCPPGKSGVIQKVFLAILTKMVNEECQKSAKLHQCENNTDSSDDEFSSDEEYEEYDEDLVLRSDKIGRIDMYEAYIEQPDMSITPMCISAFSDMPVQLDKQKFRHVCSWSDKSLNLNEVFEDSILQELSHLTNCSFAKEALNNRIHIASNTKASLNEGISKIENIKNYSRPKKSPVYHSFYTENESNVEFSFLRFSTVKNRYFRTTLIDSSTLKSGYQDSIEKAVTIRSAYFDRVSAKFRITWNLKVVPVIKANDRIQDLKASNSSTHPPKAIEEDGYESCSFENVIAKKIVPVEHHVSNINSKPKFVSKNKNPLISNWVENVAESSSLTAEKKLKKLVTTQKKLPPEGPKSYAKSLGSSQKATPLLSKGVTPGEQTQTMLRFSLNSNGNVAQKVLQGSPSHITPDTARDFWSRYSGKSSLNSQVAEVNQRPKPKNQQYSLVDNRDMGPRKPQSQNIIDDRVSYVHSNLLMPSKKCEIPETRNESLSSTNHKKSIKSNSKIHQQYSTPISNAGLLQLASKQRINISNKTESNPRAKLPLPSPTREIIKPVVRAPVSPNWEISILERFQQDICLNFDSMIAKLRAFRGELIVEASFGRIITHGIPDKLVSRKGEDEKTYKEGITRQILDGSTSNSLAPTFTKILTTMPAEIQYITEMKNSSGSKIWSQNENNNFSFYELHFSDKRASVNNKFIIEIDSKSFACRVKTSMELGIINVHATKRLWDFRISTTGKDYAERPELKYRDLIEMISSSLSIPENCTKPDITFEIKGPLGNQYILDKAMVRHVNKYLSQDHESNLLINEVKLLKVLSRKSPQNGSTIVRAIFLDDIDQDHPEILNFWFEISLSSRRLDIELAENQKLELGELADWSIESLKSSSVAQSIYYPACWMLEILDGVGSYNDNGFNIKESTQTPRIPQKPVIEPYYW